MAAAMASSLQVAVHEVYLLQPAQTLADVLRPYLSHSLDRLELCITGGQQLIQSPELLDDLAHHELRQARNAPENPVTARRYGVVKRVQLGVVAQQLRQAAEVEEILMGQAPDLVQRGGERLIRVVRQIVVHERR